VKTEWVEYCNIENGTSYADLRIKNGHKLPHKVICWGLGNELDGSWQMGHKNAEDYGKFALETAKLMKGTDKNIKDQNSAESQLVKTKPATLNVNGKKFNYRFPAHSFTMMIIPLKPN